MYIPLLKPAGQNLTSMRLEIYFEIRRFCYVPSRFSPSQQNLTPGATPQQQHDKKQLHHCKTHHTNQKTKETGHDWGGKKQKTQTTAKESFPGRNNDQNPNKSIPQGEKKKTCQELAKNLQNDQFNVHGNPPMDVRGQNNPRRQLQTSGNAYATRLHTVVCLW